MALLEARQVTVRYGGVVANHAVDLGVDRGEIVGLIGPNGAGKTTFVDAVTGFTPVSRGTVLFDGNELGRSRPEQRAVAGLGRTFQSLELFEDLTVRDNLCAAAERFGWASVLADLVRPRRRRAPDAVDDALDLLGIDDLADRLPSDLSHGQRKLVALARAVAANPQVLLLDEPAAGLDTDESAALGERLRVIRDRGVGLLLVDHDMGLVMGVCDRVAVLHFGELIALGTPDEVRSDPVVISAYLGGDDAP